MLKAFKDIYSLLTPKDKRNLIILFALIVFGSLMEAIGIGVILPFLAVVTDPTTIQTNDILQFVYNFIGFEDNNSYILFLGMGVIGFLVLSNGIRAMVNYFTVRYTQNRKHQLSVKLLKRYTSQNYKFFLIHPNSELRKNIVSEVQNAITGVLLPLLMVISKLVATLAIVGILVTIDPLIAGFVAALFSLIYITIYFFTKGTLKRLGERRLETNKKKFKTISAVLGGIKEIKLLHKEEVFVSRFDKAMKDFVQGEAVSSVIGTLPRFLLEILSLSSVIVLVLYFIFSGQDLGEIVPILGLYAIAALRILPNMQQVFQNIAKARYQVATVEHLVRIFSTTVEQEETLGDNRKALSFEKSVSINKLSFKYNEEQDDILKEVSIEVTKNTTIGFVGETGSGKTTLVDVLLGLYPEKSGNIHLDQTPLKEDDLRRWQKSVAYVPQSIFLVNDTFEKNIAFGLTDEDIDKERVIKSAKMAKIHDFIMESSEDGYDRNVGELGVNMSGGQKQRIGIARALYRRPQLLIMDEATSALDGITERNVMDAIDSLAHKTTIIMIAHRITTVKKCDQIYMFDKGQIIDKGTYDDLIERNSQFRQMAGEMEKEDQKYKGK